MCAPDCSWCVQPRSARRFSTQYNAPLFSCPICAQWVIVVFGSEVNAKASREAGENGGLVAGVLTVTAMGDAALWIKSPLKVLPLLKLHLLTIPVQCMR